MDAKSYSLLICFLLGSTFVHELRAKNAVPISNNDVSRVLVNRAERAAETVDYSSVYETLSEIGEIYIYRNLNSNDAMVVDYTSKIGVLLNGTTGSGIVFDICNNKGAYISNGLWEAKSGPLTDFLNSLESGLIELFEKDEGEAFNLDSPTLDVLEEVTNIVVKLVLNVEGILRKDPTQSLKLIISIIGGAMSKLKVLQGFNKVVGNDTFEIHIDLVGLLNILEGIAIVVERVAGDLNNCIEKGVKFDLNALFGAKNGVDRLNILLRALGEKFDLSPLDVVLGDPENLFKLLAKLGGNSPEGVTGVFKVAGEVAALAKNKTKPEETILAILQYVAFTPSECKDLDLSAESNSSISFLLKTVKDLKATEALPGLVGILEDLIGGTLKALGVDLSAIIGILLGGVVGLVEDLIALVIEVLLLLDVVLETVLAIPFLLLVLISQVNTPYGIELLNKLGIDVLTGLDAILVTLDDILETLLSTVTNLLSLVLLTLFDLLAGLPIIGDIITALNLALEKASDGRFSLEELLNQPNLVTDLLKGLIQSLTGLNLGVDPSVARQAMELMKSTSDVTTYVYTEIESPDKTKICF